MFQRERDNREYLLGFITSAVGHVAAFLLSLLILGRTSAQAVHSYEVFSVTLEGGEKLGGISQVPEEKWTKKALPNATEPTAPEPETTTKAKEASLEQPSIVEDPVKALEEKKKKEAAEAKKLAEQKKKEEAAEKERKAKEKAEQEKKRADQAAEEQRLAKERAEKDRKNRDKMLNQAIARAANTAQRYRGESADAGGEGFGAARLGGKGMGGGTVVDPAFLAYINALEAHIKSGWRWLPGPQKLQVQIQFSLLPNGVIQSANVLATSGNRLFDDSALRAVMKASPAPPPPADYYEKFRNPTITFDTGQ